MPISYKGCRRSGVCAVLGDISEDIWTLTPVRLFDPVGVIENLQFDPAGTVWVLGETVRVHFTLPPDEVCVELIAVAGSDGDMLDDGEAVVWPDGDGASDGDGVIDDEFLPLHPTARTATTRTTNAPTAVFFMGCPHCQN